ncbi:pyridoxamine 5'-phosphate oxidase family protein [Thalassolituus hydrocarboniclasticus]|uniref:Pyridoxamine 5'-phosphate oxidase family protein n=1 Tax=Thalassolituus hydrocarboniclasticus TaxID=2742796 RepID=A0ABY6ACL0_9GAMM|nr:pyridoxamine 5'-phosphate oxidase family protein [Thalassolituus hydrocarboniclasticus]UXD88774.1 pyridoxamine 5'-phosphate oxidase family protein [Thalassolituus hydrocarboniclasticus]
MQHRIQNEQQLRQLISAPPALLEKRVQAQLDAYCFEVINHARVMIVASESGTPALQPVSLAHCQLEVTANNVRFCLPETDELPDLQTDKQANHGHSGQNASLYFLIPGVGHALRVNGRLSRPLPRGHWQLQVKSAYLHCARAAVRSGLWDSETEHSAAIPADSTVLSDRKEYLQQAMYLLLKTCDAQGITSVSPRGDETGVIRMLPDGRLFMAERPGNKVALSLRNLLQNPALELLLLIPGQPQLLHICGSAQLTTEPQLLTACAIGDKVPKLGLLIEPQTIRFTSASALTDAGLFDAEHQVEAKQLTPFAKALSAHMSGEGLMGKATHLVVDQVVKHDLKNLY